MILIWITACDQLTHSCEPTSIAIMLWSSAHCLHFSVIDNKVVTWALQHMNMLYCRSITKEEAECMRNILKQRKNRLRQWNYCLCSKDNHTKALPLYELSTTYNSSCIYLFPTRQNKISAAVNNTMLTPCCRRTEGGLFGFFWWEVKKYTEAYWREKSKLFFVDNKVKVEWFSGE